MNKYFISFKINLVASLEYRFNYFFILLYAFFPIFLQIFLWNSIFTGSEDQLKFGYSFKQLIFYALLSAFTVAFTNTDIQNQVSNDIKFGVLNRYLIQPISYMRFNIFGILGRKTMELLMLGLVMFVIILTINRWMDFEINLINLIVFPINLGMSFLLNYYLYLCIGFISFWIVDSNKFYGAVVVFVNVLSGAILPIDVIGDGFTVISNFLPFKYLLYVPISTLIQNSRGLELWGNLAMQICWIIIFFFLSKLLWQKGLKNYTGIGG